mmetsp:Transcript_25369/g.51867  ORF Transcript_25369/g.51867 Transcript_25369/m.51867 type:complete len:93 (-) Transcript_25369:90-368(-)
MCTQIHNRLGLGLKMTGLISGPLVAVLWVVGLEGMDTVMQDGLEDTSHVVAVEAALAEQAAGTQEAVEGGGVAMIGLVSCELLVSFPCEGLE